MHSLIRVVSARIYRDSYMSAHVLLNLLNELGERDILAWEFVTRSCLKLQNPCSNHEIHVLFEHGFY